MFVDILVIPNFFSDPESIREVALTQQYYSLEENPIDRNTGIKYAGRRTLPLEKNIIDFSNCEITSFFHCLNIGDTPGRHTDTTEMAGIIYLNPIEKKDSGTIIFKDGKEIVVPYEYNKLVLYKGSYVHQAGAGFGNTIKDGRLTLNIFYNRL